MQQREFTGLYACNGLPHATFIHPQLPEAGGQVYTETELAAKIEQHQATSTRRGDWDYVMAYDLAEGLTSLQAYKIAQGIDLDTPEIEDAHEWSELFDPYDLEDLPIGFTDHQDFAYQP